MIYFNIFGANLHNILVVRLIRRGVLTQNYTLIFQKKKKTHSVDAAYLMNFTIR